MSQVAVADWLNQLAGNAKRVRLNARTTSELVTNTHCSARRALDAAGIDKAALAKQLGVDSQRGQSPFALTRGNQFERRVKRDEYLELMGLLREQGLDTKTVDILDLRTDYPFTATHADDILEKRATVTRQAIVAIAKGQAPPGRVIDGAALVWHIGGVSVRLETDALAWWVGGKLRVVEMKSYPIEWGQISADKVSAMAWQTAVYVAAVQDLLEEEGLDKDLVSTEIYLVCPRNTGLKPVMVPHDVAPQLRLLRRYELRETSLADLAAEIGDVTIDISDVRPAQQHAALADAVARLKPSFQPNCLSTCDLAGHCRACAQAAADPGLLGGEVVQLLVGVSDMHRAALILDGGRPSDDSESDFASLVEMGHQVEKSVLDKPTSP